MIDDFCLTWVSPAIANDVMSDIAIFQASQLSQPWIGAPSGKPYSTSLHTTSFRLGQRVSAGESMTDQPFGTWDHLRYDMTRCIQHPCQV